MLTYLSYESCVQVGAALHGDCWIEFGKGQRNHLAARNCLLLASAPVTF